MMKITGNWVVALHQFCHKLWKKIWIIFRILLHFVRNRSRESQILSRWKDLTAMPSWLSQVLPESLFPWLSQLMPESLFLSQFLPRYISSIHIPCVLDIWSFDRHWNTSPKNLWLWLSKSRHFQPTPVQTIDKTINTVNGVGNEERGIVVRERTRDTFRFSPSLICQKWVVIC